MGEMAEMAEMDESQSPLARLKFWDSQSVRIGLLLHLRVGHRFCFIIYRQTNSQ